jgi:hypothetical protein
MLPVLPVLAEAPRTPVRSAPWRGRDGAQDLGADGLFGWLGAGPGPSFPSPSVSSRLLDQVVEECERGGKDTERF